MRICLVAAAIDIAFFFLFQALGSPILAWVNIFSVLMYACAHYAVRIRKKRFAITLIWTEVLLHAALGIVLIGWDSGFHYFLLMFIPAICVSTSRKPALFSLLCLFAFYIGLDVLTWFFEPVQPINTLALNIVHIFNLSTVFLMLSYMSFFYLSTVRRAQRKLRLLAETDPLTELFNRRHMSYLADKEVERFQRTNDLVSIMLIDIDHFKSINDNFGHEVGDKVLVKVSQIITEQVRSQDLVSRWGGEEFLIVLPSTSTQDAMVLAERVRIAFVDFDWQSAIDRNLCPTISTGVTELRQAENMSAAIARADRALYQGKTNGRNRVEYGKS